MKFNYKTCSPPHSRFCINARFSSCCIKLDLGWMEKRKMGSFEAFMLSWNKLFKNSPVLLSGASNVWNLQILTKPLLCSGKVKPYCQKKVMWFSGEYHQLLLLVVAALKDTSKDSWAPLPITPPFFSEGEGWSQVVVDPQRDCSVALCFLNSFFWGFLGGSVVRICLPVQEV